MELGNKLLLKKKNTTIIEETLKRIKASKVNEVILVLGRESAIFKKKINDDSLTYVINENYNDGISSSIKSGFEKINQKSIAAIVCLGDMPLVKTSTYNKIINYFYENKSKNIVPCFKNKKGNPVLFYKFYFKKLMKLEGDYGAKFLIKKYPQDFLHLPISDEGILKDIDNANQYYSFLKNETSY